jgi:hypothetical protein
MRIVRNTTISVQNEDFVRGDSVEVDLAGGKQAERLVWEVVGNTVYVCTEKTYERLLRGDMAALPIGFPMNDVRALA